MSRDERIEALMKTAEKWVGPEVDRVAWRRICEAVVDGGFDQIDCEDEPEDADHEHGR